MPYEPHDVFAPPRTNAPILRYMNFVKFVWLLDRKSLYFTRVDRLGDRFEGSMSRANLVAREALDPRSIDAARPELLRQEEVMRRALPQYIYVNCWTLGSYESVAMWRLYVGDGNGVAIESSFRRLTAALRDEPRPVFVGKMKYIDYSRDFVPEENAMHPFMRKRRNFEYEKEVRALTSWLFKGASENPGDGAEPTQGAEPTEGYPTPPPPLGLAIPIDLDELIIRVRVSPVSPLWFTELVQSVIRRYGLNIAVSQSDIDGDPVY